MEWVAVSSSGGYSQGSNPLLNSLVLVGGLFTASATGGTHNYALVAKILGFSVIWRTQCFVQIQPFGTLNKMGALFFFSLSSWGETEAVPSLEFPQAMEAYHSATI